MAAHGFSTTSSPSSRVSAAGSTTAAWTGLEEVNVLVRWQLGGREIVITESLLRVARRHTRCQDDAEDAYQRALERGGPYSFA